MKIYVYHMIYTLLLFYQVQSQNSFTSAVKEEKFQSSTRLAGVEEDFSHECLRDCSKATHCMTCHYKFKAEWYLSMSTECYDCPFNITDCFRPFCVVLDGVVRPIVTINRRFPGPSIQVCEGDEIIVDLENDLQSEATTIHWHGIHQVGTPYMDGVPFLTQCPILPGNWFRYHFIADPAGTHFWHSHTGFQRDDGIFGSLIVRPRKDPHAHLYDVDDPRHQLLVMEWFDKLVIDNFLNNFRGRTSNEAHNVLVNGLGKYLPFERDNKSVFTPLYEFRVRPGLRYRFRTISNIVLDCPIEISVDNHTLLVIASDGQNIEPLEVDTLVIYAGERWDFVVNANQWSGVYWFKFRGLLECGVEVGATAHQVAVLRYDGSPGFPNQPNEVNYNFTERKGGLKLNPLNAAPGDLINFYTVADLRSHQLIEEPSPYARTPDHKFWLEMDFQERKHDWFHTKDFYPNGVDPEILQLVTQINNITHKPLNVPPLSQPDDVNPTLLCNETTRTDCKTNFCYCTHVLNIELGSLVELILVDTGTVFSASHPFHMHGYVFAVLGMERLGENTTLKAIQDLDREGKLMRNLVNPPLKDTNAVPDGGYTVIRFIADNPGYWFFHCHITFHFELGMSLVLHVGERKHLPPVPQGFPQCGSFVPKPVYDLQNRINKWKKYTKKL